MKRKHLIYAMILLSVLVFAGLAIYGWRTRFGPPQGELPAPFAALTVPYLHDELTLDESVTTADVWKRVPALDVTLMHQITELPWPKGHVPKVAVQAFHNGRNIYFRMNWDDTRPDANHLVAGFPDGCAVAMPLSAGPPPRSIMMGFSSLVNFWYWKADLDAQFWSGALPSDGAYSDRLYPFEDQEVLPVTTPRLTSAVSDLLAARPGSLTMKERQAVRGRGRYADGQWSVVFERSLGTDDPNRDVQVGPGAHAAAFAVWDGAHQDRGARKSMSDWVVLQIQPSDKASGLAGQHADGTGPAGPRAAGPAASLAPLALAATDSQRSAPSQQSLTEEGSRLINVTAKRFEFTPSNIVVQRGERVTVRLESLDVTHGLYIDGYEIKIKARPGLVGKATFLADKPGRFSFRCSETCGEFHPYMIGYLSVEPNTRFAYFAWLSAGTGCAILLGAAVSLIRRKKGASQ